MHFESAAEIMSKRSSSYKDLFWHVKTSNSKDSLPTQSSLLSSLRSCCTRSIVGLRNCWPSRSTEWTVKCLKGKSHLWEHAVSHSHSQEQRALSRVPSSTSAQPGTAGDTGWAPSPGAARWHWGQQNTVTLWDIPQIGILQILCKQLWEIPSAAGWILPSCCPTQEKSLNIIAPGTCFWQNPAQYLCLLLIFRAHCTFEGTDTSKCYMSYRDFALVGKTFVCLLIVINIILTVGCSQNVCFLSSVLSFVSLKSDLLKEKKTSFN